MPVVRTSLRAALAAVVVLGAAGCWSAEDDRAVGAATPAESADSGAEDPSGDRDADRREPDEEDSALDLPTTDPVGPALSPDPSPPEPALADGVSERPGWLGDEALAERDDGHGVAQPTPEELADRRLATPEPPAGLSDPEGEEFAASVSEVPEEVTARSTWRPECPVGLEDLRHVTLTFWGFDERAHTGELLVHRRAADDIVAVFEELYEARFPIEEMRVVSAEELDAPPTGDGNNTTMFVCRDIAGASERWSQHAYGLAIDINPFHNPYLKGDLVLPELSEAYLERDDDRPGMIQPGDVVVEAFAEIGWGWGGEWQSLDDWMHFSENGL